MSVYILDPSALGLLAAFAVQHNCVIKERGLHFSKEGAAQAVAKGLARENIRSVACRYPEDESGSRPGPCLKDEEIEEAAAIYATHFVTNPQGVAPIQIIKLCQSYDYQSCETDDWKDTLAWQQINWILGAAIRCLNGYEDAKWDFQLVLPEVEALYAQEEN
jgi:hypothetical protein